MLSFSLLLIFYVDQGVWFVAIVVHAQYTPLIPASLSNVYVSKSIIISIIILNQKINVTVYQHLFNT